jgi:hypothetical protein
VRVVPDLGDELLMVIDRVEALLGSVAVWQIEDDVGLPAPFAISGPTGQASPNRVPDAAGPAA